MLNPPFFSPQSQEGREGRSLALPPVRTRRAQLRQRAHDINHSPCYILFKLSYASANFVKGPSLGYPFEFCFHRFCEPLSVPFTVFPLCRSIYTEDPSLHEHYIHFISTTIHLTP